MSESESYLDMKRRKGFNFLDGNHDGIVTRKEFLDCGLDLAKVVNATPEDTARAKEIWEKWCDIMFLPAPHDTGLNLKDFIDNHQRYWTSGRLDEIIAHNNATWSNFFDMIDMNKDGNISREELGFFYHALGCKNEKFIERVYRKLDLNEDGYITKDEYVRSGTEFWTNSDPKSGYEFIYDLDF